jgi:hypothetical protein
MKLLIMQFSPTGCTRICFKILVEKPEGKRPLGRVRGRDEDNILMDLQVIGWNILLKIVASSGLLRAPYGIFMFHKGCELSLLAE